ncbi:MAG: nitrogen regulatory IIA protein [Agriterribacter sp.]
MKKLRTAISNWFDRLDEQWRAMPVKKQHRYTLLLFAGYALLSFVVLVKVCYDVAKTDNKITIEHIENPVIKQNKSSASPQDSIITILKNKLYER